MYNLLLLAHLINNYRIELINIIILIRSNKLILQYD